MRCLLPATTRDRGATIPIVALALPVLILMVAFAVDLGMQRSNRRTMQARADIIALDLVRLTDGRTEAEILADPVFWTTLNGSADRNEVPVSALQWDFGTWTAAGGFDSFGEPPDAVQVTATQTEDYFFQPGTGTVVRSAVATTDRIARGKLGSFAARASTGSSPLLGSVLGDALNTSVLGYEGLLSSDIDLALLAAELDLGTPSEVLSSDITLAELYHASAEAIRNDPNSDVDDLANANVFDAIATSVTGTGTVQLGDVLEAEQGGEDAALEGTVNAFDLLAGSAMVANGTNALAVPALTLDLGLVQVGTPCNANPGDDVTEVCSALSVIQGPVTFTGHIGEDASTNQARARVGTTGGVPGLTAATSQFDISLATGTATIEDITCGAPRTVTIGVATGLADASLRVTGSIVVLGQSLPVVITLDRPPSSATESAVFTEQLDGTWTPDPFEAGTQDLGLSGVTAGVTVDTSLVPALLRGAVNAATGAVLAPVVSAVTGALLTALDAATTPLLHQLGLNLAGADVSALMAKCDLPKLVD